MCNSCKSYGYRRNLYVHNFLKFKCSGDILGSVGSMDKPEKEISEAMGVIRYVKPLTLQNPMKYNVLDLCAGNALSSITSVFTLPVKKAVAFDIHKKKAIGDYKGVKRFQYIQSNIYEYDFSDVIDEDTITTAIHPCKNLALKVIDIFLNSPSRYLVMSPCCIGNHEKDLVLDDIIGSYREWCYYLYKILNEQCSIVRYKEDQNCISERNIYLYAEKSEVME